MRVTLIWIMLISTASPLLGSEAPVRSQHRSDLMPVVSEWLEERIPDLIRFYQERHAQPELSLHEAKSAAAVAGRLTAAGYTVTEKVGGHGVIGVLANGDGPVVMVRGDMDALPITEATGLPYSSKVTFTRADGTSVGVMHACGHDLHMTNLVAVAEVLARTRESWLGTVLIVAQPAEEIGQGAAAMVADGLFERFPRPDYCLALHQLPSYPAGVVAYTSGWATANVDSVDITIYGRGGHGSRPHETIDPVVTAAHVIVALQTVVSRRVDPGEAAVVTVGSVHSGSKHNIIPAEARLQLTVRSFSEQTRTTLLDGIREVTLNTSRAMGCTRDPQVTIREQEFTPSGYNHPDLTAAAVEVLAQVIGPEQVVPAPALTVGEDFAVYARHLQVPGLMLWLGSANPERFQAAQQGGEPVPALHTAAFSVDPEPTLRTGVSGVAAIALSLLERQR
jgi:hippurate hydrolase